MDQTRSIEALQLFQRLQKGISAAISVFLLMSCQHAPTQFTAISPPSLPNFNQQSYAPKVNLDVKPISLPQSNKFSANLYWHQWQPDQTRLNSLNRVRVIALTPQQAINSPDVLVQAMNEYVQLLAINSQDEQASCLDNLKISASMHSLSIESYCQQTIGQQLFTINELLQGDWLTSANAVINIDKLSHSLKLNKHIGAFTGSEINQVYLGQLLGKTHPYYDNLNNNAVVEKLSPEAIHALLKRTTNNAFWHVFTDQQIAKPSSDTQLTTKVNQYITRNLTIANLQQTGTAPTSHAQSHSTKAKDRPLTLHMIDAPGTVQIQVRLGYSLNEQSPSNIDGNSNINSRDQNNTMNNSLSCKVLAALLGRSFSGRLFYDLREVRGLTYGIYGQCNDAPLAQYLTFYGSSALQHSGAFIEGILAHMSLIQTQAISDGELNALKTYLIGQQTLLNDSQNGKENTFLNNQLLNKPINANQQFLAQIEKLSAQDITNIADHVLSANPVIVIRGDKALIESDILQKLPNWTLATISAER
ncbi:M16 family metallopeptidase [Shewanella aestuarii]|uniref:Insulinase family protein n=1 Tax=Shewanella aestuarii TaxID=1028752 RepID=A0A6G9QHP4_9GAMM|nr:insulinase family protein [Shewanella aestuarii]QIR13663.1 insulinase family protein [Shewanella aestuarii]